MKTKNIYPGQHGRAIMPHSEVCMHMKVAGKPMYFQFLENGMVQLYDFQYQTKPFSAPILAGEAGIYHDGKNHFYFSE